MTGRSPITKSKGVTASEKYLAKLCERSFLSLWSYPNVYRDQGLQNGKGVGKELCDVLVVFGEHIIIFSDKSCLFPDTGNISTDWDRWFRRAVKQSTDQVYGAERWLQNYPDRIFVDPKCTQAFPIKLPSPLDAKIHRIVVALNAGARCQKHFGNSGHGSLIIRPSVVGEDHKQALFTIGRVNPAKGYVHVFDDTTLDIILGELDTITDLTDYLSRKENAITSGRIGGAAGEEELLAHYLTTLNKDGVHDIVVPDGFDSGWFIEGAWKDVVSDARYIAKKSADQISYAWDRLIEQFNRHIAGGTLETGADRPLSDHEIGVRLLASEPRFHRRNLAGALIDLIQNAGAGKDSVRHLLSKQSPERGYIFLVSDKKDQETYDEYRQRRAAILAAYCHVAKIRTPNLVDIVGIAVDRPSSRGGSEDLLYLNAREWTDEDEARTRELQQVTGILVNPNETQFHENEYPQIQQVEPVSIPKSNRAKKRASREKARRDWRM